MAIFSNDSWETLDLFCELWAGLGVAVFDFTSKSLEIHKVFDSKISL